jgi:hypothetical protein
MPPNDANEPKGNKENAREGEKAALNDLHAEGVDIVAGSGASLENEFSQGGEAPSAAPTETESAPSETIKEETVQAPKEPAPIESPVRQFSREDAAKISSLQEMPIAAMQRPREEPVKPASQIDEAKIERKNDPSIKPLRTFKSDAEEAVKYQNVSAIDIAVAEQKKREKTPIEYERATHRSPGAFVAIAIFFMLVLAGGWYYWFFTSQEPQESIAPTVAAKAIIPYAKGSTVALDAESDPLVLIAAKIAAGNAGLGEIYAVVPLSQSVSTERASLAEIFAGTDMPSRLARSLSDEYMFGSYTYETESPFIILKTTYFQNAFAGMLEWEESLAEDLLPLIEIAHKESAAGRFQDAVVSNIDARVLKDQGENIILAYAFPDKDTFVITTGTSSLRYILDKLLAVRTIQ